MYAQQAANETVIKRAHPYATVLQDFPTLTIDEYDAAVSDVARQKPGTGNLTPAC